MSSSDAPKDNPDATNRPPNPTTAATSSTPRIASRGYRFPFTSAWPENTHIDITPSMLSQLANPFRSPLSATSAQILSRIYAGTTEHAAGTPAFEAKRAEVLQNYVTSDKLPTPQPIANVVRKGRGGRVSTPSQLKTEIGATPSSTGATPTSARGSGRGRGRGKGRGGGRGKRKRSESFDSDDDDSDISSTYTPLPTKTKSGRNVNKPVAFVPTLPEPATGVKRRRSTKTILAAQCNICRRGTDPGNNRIVFCDVCNTAYHQYCHEPPIDNDVVTVLEKEWSCAPCQRSKQTVVEGNAVEGTDGLVAGEGLSLDAKRAYLSTLPPARLVSLLIQATIRHPSLPIFPPSIEGLAPAKPITAAPTPTPKPTASKPPQNPPQPSITSPPNGLGSTGHTPRSQPALGTDSSEMDPAEAQLLGEIDRSHKPTPAPGTHADEYDDGYNTDPPAHYPKPGNGLARTMRPETEDLQWLVDDNFDVFSHNWKGDGSGIGPDALNGGAMDVS